MRFSIKKVVFYFWAFALLPAVSIAEESGAWKFLPPTPTARTEVAAVNHQDKLYLIGGFTPDGVTGQVEVYDPQSGGWSKAAPLPRPLHHTTAVSAQGKIYVVGGFSSVTWTPVNTVYAYDASQNKWTQQASMPTERGALAAAVIDGLAELGIDIEEVAQKLEIEGVSSFAKSFDEVLATLGERAIAVESD